MICKNCNHEIYGRRYNIGRGEIKMEYKHKKGGNYCKVLNYKKDYYGEKCMCHNAEPKDKLNEQGDKHE